MAMYEYITNDGYRLLQRMLMGEVTLDFTRVEMGDGNSPETDLKKVTALSNVVVSLEVDSVVKQENNTISISAMFTNEKLKKGFYFREKGLYAKGLDGSGTEQEILFSYANAADTANYIDPPTVELVEKKIISHCTQCQKTDGVIDIVIKSGIYAEIEYVNQIKDMLETHLLDKENPHKVNAKQVGLDKVNNTSDEDKPVSKAQQQALDELETNVKAYTDEKVDPLSESVSNALSASSVSGNNPTANNSTDGKPSYLNVGGYTEQKTLSGKNLFNPYTMTSTTLFGVTYSKNDDNSFSVNGTATQLSLQHIGNVDLKAGTTYILSGGHSDASLTLRNSGGDVTYCQDNGEGAQYTPTEDMSVYLFIRVASGVTVSNAKVYPMVRTTGNATYEPYVGGTASPNPDYPQHIASNGDKGYFDGVLQSGYYNGTTGALVASQASVSCKNPILCSQGDSIHIKCEEIIPTLRVLFYDNEDNFISTDSVTQATEITSEVPQNTAYMRFNLGGNGGNGGNGGTSFTPSTAKHICVTINGMYALRVETRGKNILPITTATRTTNGITLTINNDGTVTCNGTATASTYFVLHKFNLLANTKYILSGCPSGGSYSTYFLAIDGMSNNIFDVGNGSSYSVAKDVARDVVLGIMKGTTVSNLTFKPMIRLDGMGDDTFEPYTETTALIPVSSPFYDGDYIEVYADGSGQIVRENDSYIVNGSETITIQSTNNNGIVNYQMALNTEAHSSAFFTNAKSTHLLGQTQSIASVTQEGIAVFLGLNATTLYLRLSQDRFSTVEELKTWLTSNPITCIYKRETPTSTPLTAEQVDAFRQLQTFNGVTHVNADGEVVMRYYANTDSGETVSILQNKVIELDSKLIVATIPFYDGTIGRDETRTVRIPELYINQGYALVSILKRYAYYMKWEILGSDAISVTNLDSNQLYIATVDVLLAKVK